VQAIVDSHHGTDAKSASKVRFSEPGAGGEVAAPDNAPNSKGGSPQLSQKAEKEADDAKDTGAKGGSPKKAVTV